MLGKAPGTALLNEWYGVYNASVGKGMSPEDALLELANHIAASSAFTSMYPFFITNREFATEFLTAALGEAPPEAVLNLAEGLLNDGMGRGEMGLLAVRQLFEIRMQGESHPAYGDFGALAMMFANKVQVATYYTVEKRWEGSSSSVLGGVTGDGDSVDTAKEAIDMMQRPGKSFELTAGVDRLDGTLGDDTFVATEKTLTGVDRIDGGEGMDTLELSSSGSDDDVNVSSGTSVMNVETLTVDSGGDFSADLSDWEGLTDVVLSDVAGDVELDAGGADVSSESLGNDDKDTTVEIMNAASVDLEDVSEKTTVKITGEGTESVMVEGGYVVDVNSAAAPSETLKSVTLDGVHDGMGEDGKRYQLKEGSTVNDETVTKDESDASKDRVPVHIFSKAIESVDLRNTNTTLLVENAAKDMTELTAMVDKFGNTANGHGKLCLKGIEDLMIEVKGDSNIRLASDQIKTVAVSGAGDLTLSATKFDPAVAENKDAVKPSETLEKLTLSGSGKTTLDAMGLKKLKTVDASDASGAVKLSNLGASVMSYMGSAGKDEVSVKAFAKDGLKADLGAGDDTFTAMGGGTAKSRIDGGAGMDTLKLTTTSSATYKEGGETKSIYSNFETVVLEPDKAGTYDLAELDVDRIMIGKSLNGATFNNVDPATAFEVYSAPGKNTHAVASYMLDSEKAGRRGSELELSLLAKGGKDDTAADAESLAKRGVLLRLDQLDEKIESLTVHSSAAPHQDSGLKAGNYVNRLLFRGKDSVEEITVTGDTRLILSNAYKFEWDAAAASNLKLLGALATEAASLTKLAYVDAREHTGGIQILANNNTVAIEIHGSDANDVMNGGLGSPHPDDKMLGYGGNDIIGAGTGSDEITGGLGGDILSGGHLSYVHETAETYLPGWAGPKTGDFDTVKDTFIYTSAADSQVDFSKLSGSISFDVIARFDGAKDVIDLSDVVDLRGTIKNGNHGMNGASGGGDDFAASTAGNTLKKFVGDGGGVFETTDADRLGNEKHSVVIVDTQEDGFIIATAASPAANLPDDDPYDPFSGHKEDDVNVKWVLVDVDGDGDFDAGIDMAIALLHTLRAGSLDEGNFI